MTATTAKGSQQGREDIEQPLLTKFSPEQPISTRHGNGRLMVLALAIVAIVSLGLGLGTPGNPTLPEPYSYVSSVVGWAYFTCWSLSFYPQIYDNWRRKSVQGLSFDFEVYNLLGFGCYAIFNSALFWSTKMQAAYREHHGGHESPVQANDVFFSLHAVAAMLVMIVQSVIYETGGQRVSEVCKAMTALALLAAAAYGALVLIGQQICTCFTVLSWLYLLSYVKLAVTLFKYAPQIIFNYKRKSTEGWSIGNCLLDFGGGMLSLGQLLADAYVLGDWTAVTGDPVKFGLGFVSIIADAIFITQHYILYPDAAPAPTVATATSKDGVQYVLVVEDDGSGVLRWSRSGRRNSLQHQHQPGTPGALSDADSYLSEAASSSSGDEDGVTHQQDKIGKQLSAQLTSDMISQLQYRSELQQQLQERQQQQQQRQEQQQQQQPGAAAPHTFSSTVADAARHSQSAQQQQQQRPTQ